MPVSSASYMEAARQIFALQSDRGSPFHAAVPAGHKRGIDFYSAASLLRVLARAVHFFNEAHGHYPNLLEPRTFTEKVFWRKFLAVTKVPESGNKLRTASFIPDELKGKVRVPEVVWRSAEAKLPGNDRIAPGWYFLKANHGCGYVRRVRYPLAPDTVRRLETTAAHWLTLPYGIADGEWWYSTFAKEIFLERSLSAGRNLLAWDFYVINGAIAFIMVNMKVDGATLSTWLDEDMNVLPYQNLKLQRVGDFEKLGNYAEVREAALRIGARCNAVRVDLYVPPEGGIYLGEMTFSPGNALGRRPPEFDRQLGDMWKVLA